MAEWEGRYLMRWKEKEQFKNKEVRIKLRFLILPKKIGKETRWLELALWEETFNRGTDYAGSWAYWEPTRWLPLV
jgi:hypothetical protein